MLSRGAMAAGTIYAAVPAVVAAVGFYFIGTNYVKEIRRGISTPTQNMISEMKERANTIEKPKVAPQLDGLHCFETLV
ncbi:hypothetical protein RIF29_11351 [Crotalaria pallida]|uniref:Uncharacterized protein n=1 Tax=Crotalaria pallida TaxID=3830 RepID=A0AAN9IM07_CROPI